MSGICATLYLYVKDEAAFRRAAHNVVLAQQRGAAEAESYLDEGATSLPECAKAIFDAQVAPNGSTIIDTWVRE